MLEVQKIDYHALNDIITAASRIERLLSYMDNLVCSLQDELRVVQREMKESAAAVVENVAHMAQHPAVPPAVKSQYLDPPPRMSARQCPRKSFLCDQECHFVASCPIQAELFQSMQQSGRLGVCPSSHNVPGLPPVPPAKVTMAAGEGVSLKLKRVIRGHGNPCWLS